MAAQAPGKKPRTKKVTVGSVRPGGSLKTGKKGSSAKTVAPDPSKVGLLGVFGGEGKLSKLDKELLAVEVCLVWQSSPQVLQEWKRLMKERV